MKTDNAGSEIWMECKCSSWCKEVNIDAIQDTWKDRGT